MQKKDSLEGRVKAMAVDYGGFEVGTGQEVVFGVRFGYVSQIRLGLC